MPHVSLQKNVLESTLDVLLISFPVLTKWFSTCNVFTVHKNSALSTESNENLRLVQYEQFENTAAIHTVVQVS